MSRARRFLILASAIASLTAAAPVCAGLFDDDIARKQIVDQQKRLETLSQQQEEIAGRLARVEEELKNQPVIALATQIEALREDMRQLRGQIEVVANNIDVAAKRQRDMYVDLDSRLRRLEHEHHPVVLAQAETIHQAGRSRLRSRRDFHDGLLVANGQRATGQLGRRRAERHRESELA